MRRVDPGESGEKEKVVNLGRLCFMISFLIGRISEKSKDTLTIMTAGGVGYEVRMTSLKLVEYALNQKVSLYVYLKVAENTLDLYGFPNQEERFFFTLLMTVSGIGPKSAMNILSLGSIDEIQSAIARGDVKYFPARNFSHK